MQMAKSDEQSAELAEDEESQRILRVRKLGNMSAQDRLAAEAEEVEKITKCKECAIRHEETVLCRLQFGTLTRGQVLRLVPLYSQYARRYEAIEKPAPQDTRRLFRLRKRAGQTRPSMYASSQSIESTCCSLVTGERKCVSQCYGVDSGRRRRLRHSIRVFLLSYSRV
jgi:hypothetical protein